MKYNVSAIMSRAWEIRRAAADRIGCKVSEILFSVCLKSAWADARNTPAAVLASWGAMAPEEQVRILTANVKKAAKNEIAYTAGDNYNEYNETVAWFLRYHGLDCLVNEAYCKLIARLDPAYLVPLNERRAAAGKPAISLVALVYRSAKDAIRTVYNDDIRHGVAKVRTIKDKDGDEYSYIETMVESKRDNTEMTAVTRSALADFMEGRDDIDRIIMTGRRDGYTLRELGEQLGMSSAAIQHRINRIKKGLAAAGLAPAGIA